MEFGIWNQPSAEGIPPPPEPACVVAEALADCAEVFPAASNAVTVYVKLVDAASPPSWYVVLADVPILLPPRYTLYPVTPTLSVDAVHDKLICEDDIAVALNPVGTLGATVSVCSVKLTPLLAAPPTVTITLPVVAPVGTDATMLVALQLVAVAVVPLNFTVLVPCVAPKFAPLIVTGVPTAPDVGLRLVMLGAAVVLFAVVNVISPLVTALLFASVERTRKWYNVLAAKPLRVIWWLVTIVVLTGVLLP